MTKIPMDHLRSQKKPVTTKVTIAGDTEVAQELLSARETLTRLETRLSARQSLLKPGEEVSRVQQNAIDEVETQLKEAQEEADRLEQQYKETALTFVFKSMGRRKYDALVEANPATEAEKKEAEAQGVHNVPFSGETFPTALILASLAETYAEGQEQDEFVAWLEELNAAEFMDMFQAALNCNTQRAVAQLGKG